ncbi:DUF397 domain-containing protein [Nocardiopsis rhodophaea]|uniref:DUF397 domain-containing protein n=1 Tax=Nocardiopsis rhodophaea TaxID=280238 RepID=A0ABN2SRU6_9ACTN
MQSPSPSISIWYKSSYSGTGGQCVEVAAFADQPSILQENWRKSSYSQPHGQCVEVAAFPGHRAMRDSKQPDSGHLTFAAQEWTAFLHAARGDEL